MVRDYRGAKEEKKNEKPKGARWKAKETRGLSPEKDNEKEKEKGREKEKENVEMRKKIRKREKRKKRKGKDKEKAYHRIESL